jgi:hypothetical protein
MIISEKIPVLEVAKELPFNSRYHCQLKGRFFQPKSARKVYPFLCMLVTSKEAGEKRKVKLIHFVVRYQPLP